MGIQPPGRKKKVQKWLPSSFAAPGRSPEALEFSRIAIMLYHVPGMEYGRTIFDAAMISDSD
ncbi:MAG: hypothetical protein C4519_27480 [Desulfobacteraceae bacterium]|nr:MAG: hypothetical protein C4519_27480 [Desulfobacteraceae bacterium]